MKKKNSYPKQRIDKKDVNLVLKVFKSNYSTNGKIN